MDDKLVRMSDVIAAMNSEGYTKNMRVHKKVLSIPAVDAVEVVRCEDCQYAHCVGANVICNQFYGAGHFYGYCAWGKRREEEHNAAD